MKDQLKGGRADKKKPSDFDSEQLRIGTDHEMEHTKDRSVAKEIAMDHLAEDASYYTKLKDMEKSESGKFHIYKDGYQVTGPGEAMTMKEIEQKHGVKKLNNSGHIIKPATIDKYDRVDEEADGKKELDYGKEELEKSKIRTLWDRLKKALDNSSAIMNIEDEEEVPDEEPAPADEAAAPKGEEPAPEEEGEEVEPEGEEAPEDAELEEEAPEGEEDPDEVQQKLIEALKADGHSDQEIDYIVHGHAVPQSTEDDYSAENERASGEQDLQHKELDADMQRQLKQRDADRDHEHKTKMNELEHQRASMDMNVADPEYEKQHKQRMLDLEYEKAKAEMEMELEFKQKELEQKMKLKEEAAKAKKKEQASDKSKG